MGGNGLGIAKGIELGAQNFLNSYLAVKQQKHEEKYRKLAPIIQVINTQISDPNIPLDQKIKAMDSLPYILDPKYSGSKLSQQLGLDRLAEQEVDTGESQTIQGQKGGLVEDPNASNFNKLQTNYTAQEGELSTDSNLATSIQTKSTKTLKKPLLRRRGELSANDINLMKQMKLQTAEDESQFQRQYRLALVQADLQEKVLNRNGWKNNGDWTYDGTTKTWQQEWFNPITKESYQQKLTPGVVPETVILKQIQASGRSGQGGVSKAYSTLRTAIATSMGLEEDDPKVQVATANMWKSNFQATVDYKQQGVEGTRKPQPAQIADDKRADEQNRIALQGQLDFARSKAVESSNKASITANEANAFYNNNIKPLEAREQSDDLDDDEKRLLSSNRNEYQRLKNVAAAADAEDKGNKVAFQAAQERLSSHGTSTSSTSYANVSARMKTRIDIFRKKNPNFNGTDEQAAALLRSQGYKD